MNFIKAHYTEKIGLEQLAAEACLSVFHFQRNFKAMYEKSPLEVITHLRLKKACMQLRKTKLPVDSIAIQCGFEESGAFIRLFKKRFAQTPGAFRKRTAVPAAGLFK